VQAAINHKIAQRISDETVRQVLLRHDLKPWLKKRWSIAQLSAEYIERMLVILEVYERPYDPKRPVIGIDEKSVQLLASKRKALALGIGKAKREDYEYVRNGAGNALVAIEPLGAGRHGRITKQRRGCDFAAFVNFIVMVKYHSVDNVVIVTDNLSSHFAKSLIETFSQTQADKILVRMEWHYTPKHASWLAMAEIEINVLSRQCLSQRLGTREEAIRQVRAWPRRRNHAKKSICWQFTQTKPNKFSSWSDTPFYL
jgi:hypothetical protein